MMPSHTMVGGRHTGWGRLSDEGSLSGGNRSANAVRRHLHRQLMTSDPFYTCGLRQGVKVLHWSKALERKVLV